MRVHILGASGSGTTTLGVALSQRSGWAHFDADDYYWLPSDPPFEAKRPPEERVDLLQSSLGGRTSWVVSGSMMSWGDTLIPQFDLVVFVLIPAEIRMQRLRSREVERYGTEAIEPGGHLHEKCEAFLEWAGGYENSTFPGRSLKRHEDWLAALPCPVLRLEGDQTTAEQVTRILATTS